MDNRENKKTDLTNLYLKSISLDMKKLVAIETTGKREERVQSFFRTSRARQSLGSNFLSPSKVDRSPSSGYGRSGMGMGIGAGGALAALGIGIGGLLAGIGAGAWAVKELGGAGNLKDTLVALAEGLNSFNAQSLLALGAVALAGAGAAAIGKGTSSAIGAGGTLAAFGVGLGGFIAGLALGIAGAGIFSNPEELSGWLTALSSGLNLFDVTSLQALGAVAAAGVVTAAIGKGTSSAIGAGGTLAAIGLGMGGFIAGISLGISSAKDSITSPESLSAWLIALSSGIGSFNTTVLNSLAAIAGTGVLLGTAAAALGKTGAKLTLGAIVGSGLTLGVIGGGLGLFIAGFGLGIGLVSEEFNQPSLLKDWLSALSGGLNSFSETTLKVLATIAGFGAVAGGIAGASLGAGLPAALGAVVGAGLTLGVIGGGLGLFIAGIGLGIKLADSLTTPDQLTSWMTSISGGLNELVKIDGKSLISVSEGIGKLGPAMFSLFGAQGLQRIGEGAVNLFNKIFRRDPGTQKTIIEKLIDLVKPIENIKTDNLKIFSDSLINMATGIEKLASLSDGQISSASRAIGLASTVSSSVTVPSAPQSTDSRGSGGSGGSGGGGGGGASVDQGREGRDRGTTSPSRVPSGTGDARSQVESFLRRQITDEEYAALLKAVSAEASSNAQERAAVATVILNRAKMHNGSIIAALNAPKQFQAITGPGGNQGSVDNPWSPNARRIASNVESDIAANLSKVDSSLTQFRSMNAGAWREVGGESRMRQHLAELQSQGGSVIGQQMFAPGSYTPGRSNTGSMITGGTPPTPAPAAPRQPPPANEPPSIFAGLEKMLGAVFAAIGDTNNVVQAAVAAAARPAQQTANGPIPSPYDSQLFETLLRHHTELGSSISGS